MHKKVVNNWGVMPGGWNGQRF